MKKKHLNTLKIASLTLMLGCFAVGGVYNHYQEKQQDHVVKVEKENKIQPKYASYDEEQYTITLTVDELNNYSFENFFNEIEDNYSFSEFNMYLNGIEFNYYSYVSGDGCVVYQNENNGIYTSIYFVYNAQEFNAGNDGDNAPKNYVWIYENYYGEFENNLDLDFSSTLSLAYTNIKSAIELDIQANQPVNMGESIIGAISSGLGLVGDLASEFLTGFSTLFWNSTTETLTTFGLFSLVFLGIAITMAVIKLVLAIIRGSTGA